MRYRLAVVALLLVSRVADGCSPNPDRPTISEQFMEADAAYMARLRKTTRVPLPAPEGHPKENYFVEKARFEVFVTFRGPAMTGKDLETVTTITPGNCRLSVREAFDVIGADGLRDPDPLSDVWILFLKGKKPYELWNDDFTMPINLYRESDLRQLFAYSSNRILRFPPPNKSLERSRDR